MEIKSFIELKVISKIKFKQIFTDKEIEYLSNKNIIKTKVKNNILYYFFDFVGLILLNTKIVIILPKYLTRTYDKKLETIKIIRILNKYFEKIKDASNLEVLGIDSFITNFNQFALYDYLIKDYIEFGIYINHKNTTTLNGEGEINWNKTINEILPYKDLKYDSIFLDVYTTDMSLDDENYIKNLHLFYLAKASKYLIPLNEIGFHFPVLNFKINKDILGNIDYQIFKINKELESVFSDRKIKLLVTLKKLILNEEHELDKSILIYGTTAFYDVWEKACGYILKNEYKIFKKFIDKPLWTSSNNTSFFKETMIPDILVNSKDIFYIFDAKYYLSNIETNENLPGIQDITKQYLYELAFSKVEELKNKDRKNIFLMPGNSDNFEYCGKVELEFLKNIELQEILILKIPVNLVFDLYCNNKYLNLEFIRSSLL